MAKYAPSPIQLGLHEYLTYRRPRPRPRAPCTSSGPRHPRRTRTRSRSRWSCSAEIEARQGHGFYIRGLSIVLCASVDDRQERASYLTFTLTVVIIPEVIPSLDKTPSCNRQARRYIIGGFNIFSEVIKLIVSIDCVTCNGKCIIQICSAAQFLCYINVGIP